MPDPTTPESTPARQPEVTPRTESANSIDLKKAARQRAATHSPRLLDRLPPHSPEAEQAVLGCILLSPNDCMGECIARLKGGGEVFYDLRHQALYTLLAEMFDKRLAID